MTFQYKRKVHFSYAKALSSRHFVFFVEAAGSYILSTLELGSIRGTEPALIPSLFGEDQSPVKDRTRETAEIEPTLELVFQSTHCLREYTGVEVALPFVLHFTPHILEML